MNTFVEQNKKWLHFYSTASRILGWLMILFASVSFLALVLVSWVTSWGVPEERRILLVVLGAVIEKTFGWLPISIILLGIGQLLKHIYGDEYKIPWLLRNAPNMLYLFAVLAFLHPFITYSYQQMMQMNAQVQVITSICFLFANVLIFIGLGNILKRVFADHRRTQIAGLREIPLRVINFRTASSNVQ